MSQCRSASRKSIGQQPSMKPEKVGMTGKLVFSRDLYALIDRDQDCKLIYS